MAPREKERSEMGRDHRKLRVFEKADRAVIRVYLTTRRFPIEERFALQTQIRRAAVSVAANIVEGSARHSTADYLRFLNIAAGSAAEVRYLVDLASRLEFMRADQCDALVADYAEVLGGLQNLIRSLSHRP
jgi:four helix bundle protein